MNIKIITLMTVALFALLLGIYHTSAASSTSAAIQQGLPVNKPTIVIPDVIAVGPVGSAVTKRLIEKGKETIIIDELVEVPRAGGTPQPAD